MRKLTVFLGILLFTAHAHASETAVKRVVALGDSLTAGYGLQPGQDFATQLQNALVMEGINVRIENAGVSGDTSAGGLSRLEWAIAGDVPPRLVIVALGGNDLLRGLDPAVTRENIGSILAKLKDRKIPALLIGMKSPTNLGPLYQRKFDKVYPDLAKKYDVPLYPFFLEGIAMNPTYNQDDGVHPNVAGVNIMVKNILPVVKMELQD